MHGRKHLAIREDILSSEDFWWLVGFLQGDGHVDRRNGIRLISTDREVLDDSEKIIKNLFGLGSSFYIEHRKLPQKHKIVLDVYSRSLIQWLDSIGLRFGEKTWKVPRLPLKLFCAYLGGLFDAEGQVILNPNGRIYRFVIYSANGTSLRAIWRRMIEFGLECTLLRRKRYDKPSIHSQLEVRRRQNLEWFIERIGKHCRIRRKSRCMTPELLPRPFPSQATAVHPHSTESSSSPHLGSHSGCLIRNAHPFRMGLTEWAGEDLNLRPSPCQGDVLTRLRRRDEAS